MNLFDAIECGDPEEVQMVLLRDKPDLSQINEYGNTPLHEACESGNLELVNMLLSAGADPQKGGFSASPLHVAVRVESYEIVDRLILENVDVNAIDAAELTPLMSASSSGNLELVEILISSGAKPSIFRENSGYALLFAANQGHKDVFDYLYQLTPRRLQSEPKKIMAKFSEQAGRKSSPFDETFFDAIAGGDTAKLQEAISLGVDINVRRKRNGRSAPHVAVQHNNTDMMRVIVDLGADIDAQDDDGYTALMYAVANNKFSCVELLLEFNADVDIQDSKGDTALMIDVEFNEKTEIIHLLTKRSKNFRTVKNNFGFTVLELAEINGKPDFLDYFASMD